MRPRFDQLISGIETNPAIDWQQTLLDRIDVEQKVAWTTMAMKFIMNTSL